MTQPLYGPLVLDHYRRPRNQRRLENATASAEGHNPMCGDRVRIELEVEGDVVRAAAFTANACVLCTAAASLLTERLAGASTARARAISDAEMIGWLDAPVTSARQKCVTLPLRALQQALALAPGQA
ncbi:MAG TPA: iron-sulfur cluster assembly scaffold protein [Gemmatimonadaceae bacterium]|nr:iron-sulfur cluster assembly scaffold protein [Gemmatimonadaceae bacterium]